jgi:Leucine-rich repeat (LRR) protein
LNNAIQKGGQAEMIAPKIRSLTIAVTLFASMLGALPSNAAIPPSERAALIAFYNAMNGPHWTNQQGWLGAPGTECQWPGVACNTTNTNVSSLIFSTASLSSSPTGLGGTIPPQIGDFTQLQDLTITDAQVAGPLPPEVWALPGLLELARDQLSGSVPPEILTAAAQVIALSENDLTGSVPAIANNPRLTTLDLDHNQLTGPIPPELGTNPNLTFLFLDDNPLSPGPVPDSFQGLPLTGFGLEATNRTGDIPGWIGDKTGIYQLHLGSNNWNPGPVPDLHSLTTLDFLSLDRSNLTGALPDWLGSLTGLQVLLLDGNHLTGDVPTSLTTLPILFELGLDGNKLTGTLPDALTKMTHLTYADFRWNALQASAATAAFVNAIEPAAVDFRNTQTTPPRFGLAVSGATRSSLTLHWNPIRYTSDVGRYLVYMSHGPSGPWALAKRVPGGKTAKQVTLSGLKANTTYYFYLVTTTLPNANNPNNVTSLPSAVFSGATTP